MRQQPERLEDLIAARPSFQPEREQARKGRALPEGGRRSRRAIYANDDAIRLYQQALAVLLTAASRTPERLRCASGSPTCVARLAGATRREEHYQTRAAGLPRDRRPRRRSADTSQDRPVAVGRRQADQGRGALRRGGSTARRDRCADRAGASLAGARPSRVSHGRSCRGREMGGRGAWLRAIPATGRDAESRTRGGTRDCGGAQHQGCCACAARAKPARRCARWSEALQWPKRPAC